MREKSKKIMGSIPQATILQSLEEVSSKSLRSFKCLANSVLETLIRRLSNPHRSAAKKLTSSSIIGGGGGVSCSSLPLDLIIDILARLPVKPLLRFKCVSKLWRSTITSQTFADAYLARLRSTYPRTMIFAGSYENDSQLIIFAAAIEGEGSEARANAVPLLALPGPISYTADFVHGLFCFVRPDDKVIVCNPSTRECTCILPANPATPCCDGALIYTSYAFGFDPRSSKFKILRFCWITSIYPPKPNCQIDAVECWVFTIGSPSPCWRPLHWNHPLLPFGFNHRRVPRTCVNGFIYFQLESVIFVFDVGNENFFLTRLPEAVGGNYRLKNEWGHLVLTRDHDEHHDNNTPTVRVVWVLQDPRTGVWIKQSFPLLENKYGDHHHFTTEDYDLKSKTVRIVNIYGVKAPTPYLTHHHHQWWWDYAQSLLSLRDYWINGTP